METVVKVGRTIGGGVCRAANIVVRGARRILAAIPLLGIIADDPVDDEYDSKVTGGEEAENVGSPAENKSSAVASPTETAAPAAVEAKEEDNKPAATTTPAPAPVAAAAAEASPEEKKDAPSSPIAVPTPVPVEAKNEEKEKEVVEVSQVEAVESAPLDVKTSTKSQPIVTPSIIERKTSEDFPSLLPSSPPPTPIDPSPLQQAQQAAANASALAEALKLPAETIIQCRTTNDTAYITDDQKNQLKTIDACLITKVDDDDNKKLQVEDIIVEEFIVQSEEGPLPVSSDVELTIEPVVELPEEALVVLKTDDNDEMETEIIITSEESLPDTGNEQDNDAETEVAITEIPEDESLSIDTKDETKIDNNEEEIPPPLPESPIPMPKASSDLLTFMSSQIEETPPLSEIIKAVSTKTVDCQPQLDTLDVHTVDNNIVIPAVNEISSLIVSEVEQTIDTMEIDELPLPPPEIIEQVPVSVSPSPKSPIDDLLTPPRSPSPNNESSQLEINGHGNNTMENYNSKVVDVIDEEQSFDNDSKLKDRLAETIDEDITSIERSIKHNNVQITDQKSIAEIEAPVENNINENTTETIEEAPKCQLPSVPAEAPVSIAPVGPAITEDVASVTKAIEEIDINEKAMAAAVNENIESINTNEIIADMNHQNKLNE